jgi:hypothetical protein
MLYQSTRTKHVVDIWNSRDGVTPFIVHIDGDEYTHIAWQFDRCVPWFRPKPGQYIFRSCTREDAERYADAIIARNPGEAIDREALIKDMRVGEGPILEKVAEPKREVARA